MYRRYRSSRALPTHHHLHHTATTTTPTFPNYHLTRMTCPTTTGLPATFSPNFTLLHSLPLSLHYGFCYCSDSSGREPTATHTIVHPSVPTGRRLALTPTAQQDLPLRTDACVDGWVLLGKSWTTIPLRFSSLHCLPSLTSFFQTFSLYLDAADAAPGVLSSCYTPALRHAHAAPAFGKEPLAAQHARATNNAATASFNPCDYTTCSPRAYRVGPLYDVAPLCLFR